MISVALNGLGRFGQHLLYAWLENPAPLSIDYAGDAELDVEAVCHLLRHHDRLDFLPADPAVEDKRLLLTRADGIRQAIDFFSGSALEAPWLGNPTLWLECSGRHSAAAEAEQFRCGATRQVLVSATSPGADQTVVMGFNEAKYTPQSRVLSYGSCTVNAFVPLADALQQCFGVREADVQVIHNVPAYQLAQYPDPVRRPCTLEQMAPVLLPWLSSDNFSVCYTLIPYTGPSLIDLRFKLSSTPALTELLEALYGPAPRPAMRYYDFPVEDSGARGAQGQPYNAIFPRDGIRLAGDTLRLSGYFDNENSAVRYLELACLAARAQAGRCCN